MKILATFFRRLTAWTNRGRHEQRLKEEIEEHIALQTAENLRIGVSPDEARRQAVLKFGPIAATKESYRDQLSLPSLESLIRDSRYALRRLRNAPAFTIATILTLALGVGAATAIFTLVYAVLLKPLAVANPNELYRLGKQPGCCYRGGYTQDKEWSLVSYDLYNYLRDNTKGFSELAAFSAIEPLFGERRAGRAESAQAYPGVYVSGNYFNMFGVNAYAGRTITASDDRPNAPPVAVISYRLWQERYASDPSVLGDSFDLDGKPFTLIGVAPPGFYGAQASFALNDNDRGSAPDLFLPLNTEPYVEVDGDLNKHDEHWLNLTGRIRPNVKPASAEAELRVALKQWLHLHWGEMAPEEHTKFPQQTLFLAPGGSGITALREQYERRLQVLMAASGFVLLIVCANIANLMLVRGMERRREISLSMALGSKPGWLVNQTLTESVLLSLLGGAAALAVAFAGTRLILHFAFPHSGATGSVPIDASPSLPILLFAFAVSLVTGLAFGIGPAWMATRVDPMEALRGTGRSTVRTGSLSRKILVILQTGLSLVLLSAAGLLTATLHDLENQSLGFDPDRRMLVSIEPRLAGYTYDQLTPLYRRIRDALTAVPGVTDVALSTYAPQGSPYWGGYVSIEGHHEQSQQLAAWDRVTPDYLSVIGNPIVRGRGITEQDTAGSRHIAVINEAFARKFFNNEDPIGKHFGRQGPGSESDYEVVGIAKDIHNLTHSLARPVDPFYFLPEAQHDFSPQKPSAGEVSPGSHFAHDMVILMKPGAALPDPKLRQAIASVDPNLPIISTQIVKDAIAAQFTQQRLIARLTSFFGLLSLLLASIGLYGVIAYNAGCRTSEIGVRMALGANRSQVVGLILRGGFALLALGLAIGLPLTLAAGKLLGNQLYGLSPYNPLITSAAALTLAISGLAASLIPALRASLISPTDALRAE